MVPPDTPIISGLATVEKHLKLSTSPGSIKYPQKMQKQTTGGSQDKQMASESCNFKYISGTVGQWNRMVAVLG